MSTPTFTYDDIAFRAQNATGGVVRIGLGPMDTAWNPGSTTRHVVGPARVSYIQHPDGGWTCHVGDPVRPDAHRSQAGDPADSLDVVVTVRLTVSRSAWETNYGVSGTRAIRDDVKQYVQNGIVAQLDDLGLLAQ
jgi:hypothetical protein